MAAFSATPANRFLKRAGDRPRRREPLPYGRPLTLRPIHRMVNCVGTLHAFEQVTVSAKVEGRVCKIAHDVGDRVKPGDLLLQIDPVDFDLSVRQAQSALDVELAKLGLATATATFDVNNLPSVIEAEAKLERMQERMERVRTLVERGAMSRDELSNLTSDFRSLKAEHDNQVLLAKSGLATIQMKQEALSIVRQQLKDAQIVVPQPTLIPADGLLPTYAVTSRTAAEGSFLRAGTEVFKLVMDRTLKLKAPCRTASFPKLKSDKKQRSRRPLTTAPSKGR